MSYLLHLTVGHELGFLSPSRCVCYSMATIASGSVLAEAGCGGWGKSHLITILSLMSFRQATDFPAIWCIQPSKTEKEICGLARPADWIAFVRTRLLRFRAERDWFRMTRLP